MRCLPFYDWFRAIALLADELLKDIAQHSLIVYVVHKAGSLSFRPPITPHLHVITMLRIEHIIVHAFQMSRGQIIADKVDLTKVSVLYFNYYQFLYLIYFLFNIITMQLGGFPCLGGSCSSKLITNIVCYISELVCNIN